MNGEGQSEYLELRSQEYCIWTRQEDGRERIFEEGTRVEVRG